LLSARREILTTGNGLPLGFSEAAILFDCPDHTLYISRP